MFSNNFLYASLLLSLVATPLFSVDPKVLKENIPPVSVLKRSAVESTSSHSSKRQKRSKKVRFDEVTSLNQPLKDCWDDEPETRGFPHAEVEKLRNLEGKHLVIYSDEIRATDDSPTIKNFGYHYSRDADTLRRLAEKQERLSKTIRNDETWEWGFNVLSRFWGFETETHPKSQFSPQDFLILSHIDTALLSLLGNVEAEKDFDDLYPDLYNDALDEYIDASTTSNDSKKFPNNRKRFTISRKAFETFGITKKQYGSAQPAVDSRQFDELYNYVHNQKIDAFEERYTQRSEHAKVVAGHHFLSHLEIPDDESESAEDSVLEAAQNANNNLAALSLATFATMQNLDLREAVTDEGTRTTLETRRLLLITLKMYLLRPTSWEEKTHFNRFEPGFFPEKSDERAEAKQRELYKSVLTELSQYRDPVFRELYWKIK